MRDAPIRHDDVLSADAAATQEEASLAALAFLLLELAVFFGVADEGGHGAAVAVLGADDYGAVGGEGARYVGVGVSGAAEAVGEEDCGPSAVGGVCGVDVGVFVDGNGCVVEVSREVSGRERFRWLVCLLWPMAN